jgi:hypothetical protein
MSPRLCRLEMEMFLGDLLYLSTAITLHYFEYFANILTKNEPKRFSTPTTAQKIFAPPIFSIPYKLITTVLIEDKNSELTLAKHAKCYMGATNSIIRKQRSCYATDGATALILVKRSEHSNSLIVVYV